MIILAYPTVRIEYYGRDNPGFEFRQRQKIALLQNIPTSSGVHLPYLSMDSGDLPGMMLPGERLTSHLHLLTRLRMSGVLSPPSLHSFKACTGANLTSRFTHCRGCWLNSRIGLHSLEILLASAGNRTRFLRPPACGLVTIPTEPSQLPPICVALKSSAAWLGLVRLVSDQQVLSSSAYSEIISNVELLHRTRHRYQASGRSSVLTTRVLAVAVCPRWEASIAR